MTAAVATFAAMAYLTVLGALAGPRARSRNETRPEFRKGQEVMAATGCSAATRSARRPAPSGLT